MRSKGGTLACLYLLVSQDCNKIPDENNSRRGKVYFVLQCQGISSIMAGRLWQRKAFHLIAAKKQRREHKEGTTYAPFNPVKLTPKVALQHSVTGDPSKNTNALH